MCSDNLLVFIFREKKKEVTFYDFSKSHVITVFTFFFPREHPFSQYIYIYIYSLLKKTEWSKRPNKTVLKVTSWWLCLFILLILFNQDTWESFGSL